VIKKLLLFTLVMVLLPTIGLAQGLTEKESLDAKVAKIEAEILRLEGRLEAIEDEAKITQILSLIEDHEAHLAKLKKRLTELIKPPVEETTPAVPEAVPEVEEVVEATDEVIVQPELVAEPGRAEPEPGRRFEFQIGGMAGLFAACTTALGEVRFPLPYIFGPATSSMRLAGGLCQSEDMSTRYAPIHVDCILNFPAGWFTGVENYLGGGLNYVLRMTGPETGTIGAEIFYGVESRGFGGMLFGEMGYGALRSTQVPSHRGISVMLGYRRDWGF
jgi:hypothetical protein